MEKKNNRNYPIWMIITFFSLISILGLFSILILVLYFSKFGGNELSINTSDWGNFGDLLSATIMPILMIINILVLLELTKAAQTFNKKNLEKQLNHSTCKEYQNKINDLTFNFFEHLELHRETKDKKYYDRAVERLLRIKYFAESFVLETEAIVKTEDTCIANSKENLVDSIDNLIKSEFKSEKEIEDFFKNKSKFIKAIFHLVIRE